MGQIKISHPHFRLKSLQAGKLGFDTAAVLRRVQRDPPRHERGGRRRGLRGVPARREGFHTHQPLFLRQHPGRDHLIQYLTFDLLQDRLIIIKSKLWMLC